MLKIKEIVATFLKINKESINNSTIVDKTAIKGSIMIHRMYAAISKELNREIKGYDKIRTFGDLLSKCELEPGNVALKESLPTVLHKEPSLNSGKNFTTDKNKKFSIGIDMQEVNKMPKAADFRSDVFYKQNFTAQEISYCLLQVDPLQSFAGKFAAKEAIVKADNFYKGIPFSQIEINSDSNGAPYFNDFAISISHVDKFAIAVAAKI